MTLLNSYATLLKIKQQRRTRMALRGRFYDRPEDVEWLKETHLKERSIHSFKSFIMQGNPRRQKAQGRIC